MSFHPFCYACRAWHRKDEHLNEPAPFPVGWQMDNAPLERLTARFMAMRNLLIDAMNALPRGALRDRIQHTLFAQQLEANVWESERQMCTCGCYHYFFKCGYWHCASCDALYTQSGAEVTM